MMTDPRTWNCPVLLSPKEKLICKRLKNNGKLFVFLREQRHRIFSEELTEKLFSLYADHPRGKPPIPPAQLAMATLLQAYEQKSDAGATLDAMFDARWQMVLNCLGDDEPPFSQGVLCDFRHRLVKADMDEALLEQTVKIAKEFGGFGHAQLRIALDSAPLQGQGRVEDTFNLVAHAMELVVECAAKIKQIDKESLLVDAQIKLLGKTSIKAALDIDWSEPSEKHQAINTLMSDVTQLKSWLETQGEAFKTHAELKESLSLLETVLSQNIEPDPSGGNRIKQEVSPDRRISITDGDMRHGRKSSARTINGFKQHIAIDMNTKLILATSVRPANEPEHKASELLKPKIESYGKVKELSIDRGYLAADWTKELFENGHRVIAKPWTPAAKKEFSKKFFKIDLERGHVTCPENETVSLKNIQQGKQKTARFSADICNQCPAKNRCTDSEKGRSLTLNGNENMMQKLRYYVETSEGRADARERVKVEHSLASICNRKGHKARYNGVRLNEFDLNRTAMITNLHISMNLAA